jgi:septum formation protein
MATRVQRRKLSMKSIDQKIYLASKNPGRRELLRQIGIGFELLLLRENTGAAPEINTSVRKGESPEDYVRRMAREKAEYGWQVVQWRKLPLRPVLAADTKVALDGVILARPADLAEARQMLRLLSGRTYQVMTGVAICIHDQSWQAMQRSDITFATLSDAMIDDYCSLQEHQDRFGACTVQGPAATFVREIRGSQSGILGLPLHETGQLLQQAGIRIF